MISFYSNFYSKLNKIFLWLAIVSLCPGLLNAQSTPQIDEVNSKGLAFLRVNLDSAYHYFDQVIQLSKEQNSVLYETAAWISKFRSASYFDHIESQRIALTSVDSLLHVGEESLKELGYFEWFSSSYELDLATYHYATGDFSLAREGFKELLNKLSNIPIQELNSNQVITMERCRNLLGDMMLKEGKFEQAKHFFLQNLYFLNAHFPNQFQKLRFDNQRLLGVVYHYQKAYPQSNTLLLESLKYYLENSGNDNTINSLAQRLCENYLALGKLDSFHIYSQLMADFTDQKSPHWHRIFDVRAKGYLHQLDTLSALKELRRGLDFLRDYHKEYAYREMVKFHLKEAEIYIATHELELANETLHQCEKLLTTGSGYNYLKDGALILEYFLLKIDAKLAKASLRVEEVNDIMEQAFEALNEIKVGYKSDVDKYELSALISKIIEKCLQIQYDFSTDQHQPTELPIVFRLFETGKSFILNDAVNAAKARHFSNIPDSIISMEYFFKSSISNLEYALMESANNEKSKIAAQLASRKEEYQQFISNLEKQFPKYYELKYSAQEISFKKARQFLSSGQIFISYLKTENEIFALAFDKKNSNFVKLENSEDNNRRVLQYFSMLQDPSSDESQIIKEGHFLYTIVLKDVLKELKGNKLLISPAGVLNYLPFETLCMHASDERDFIMSHYTTSYLPSYKMYYDLTRKSSVRTSSMIGYAPSYENTEFEPLFYNEKELEYISDHFKINEVRGSEAHKAKFLEGLENHEIIHLASHAKFDDHNPQNTYLVFSCDDCSASKLYINEIYNLEAGNVKMITLSSCETGLGELQLGEGFLSLSRAFFYAGAKSITSSLWSINDRSTSDIMKNYYRHLSNGYSKDRALREAKLDFIEEQRGTKLVHPYYWSAFQVWGDQSPIHSTNRNLYLVLGMISFAVLVMAFYKKFFQ